MYGKFFSSTYTGSMFGSGADVFAVWGYVIAHTQKGQVELNPKLLSAIIGSPETNIRKAIDKLCQPDPESRSKIEDGKRLIREGEYAYRVPTYFTYRRIRDEDDRREYNRKKKAQQRAREKSQYVSTCESNLSAQAEADTEANTNTNTNQNLSTVTAKKSIRPTFQEISDYCKTRNNSVDPSAWMDHYQSNGWKVGKVPMKDWRAAVRTWEKNGHSNGNGKLEQAGTKRQLITCLECMDSGTLPQDGSICVCEKGKEAAQARLVMGGIRRNGSR